MISEGPAILGADGEPVISERGWFRRRTKAARGWLGKRWPMIVGASVFWLWGNFSPDVGDIIRDILYRPDVRVLSAESVHGMLQVTVANDGKEPTVITDASMDFDSFVTLRPGAPIALAAQMEHIDVSRTYELDIGDHAPFDSPFSVDVKGFRHSLGVGESDAFEFRVFDHRSLPPLLNDGPRPLQSVDEVVVYRTRVRLRYDEQREVVTDWIVCLASEFNVVYTPGDPKVEDLARKLARDIRKLYPAKGSAAEKLANTLENLAIIIDEGGGKSESQEPLHDDDLLPPNLFRLVPEPKTDKVPQNGPLGQRDSQ